MGAKRVPFCRTKILQLPKMDDIGPRGSAKLLWQPSRSFFRCACPLSIVFVWVPGWPLAPPGGLWRLPAAAWVSLAAVGGPLRLPGCPWRPLAAPGSLATPGGPLVWGGLFHRFDRCPNHVHFLEEFIFQSVPKLVLVTPASFWTCLWGGSRWLGASNSRQK